MTIRQDLSLSRVATTSAQFARWHLAGPGRLPDSPRWRAALDVGGDYSSGVVAPAWDDSRRLCSSMSGRRLQIDDDVAKRLRAADEKVALGRLVEWLRSVDDLPDTRPLSQL